MIAVGDITHYLGDAICLVAAKTPEALAQAKALVKVDYEELPAVHNPQEAILPDAPLVHREGNLLAHKHIQRGNPAEALAKSKYLITRRFSTPGRNTPFWNRSAPWPVPMGTVFWCSPRIRVHTIPSTRSWECWTCLRSR